MMHKASYYTGEPVLTVFETESWSKHRPVVFLLRYPELLRLYQKQGLPATRVRECARSVFDSCEPFLSALLRGEADPQSPTIGAYLRANWRFPEAWSVLSRASRDAGRPRLLSKFLSATAALRRRVLRNMQ